MQIITDKVWDHIRKKSNGNKNRYVAVAYLGTDASKYLRLESGDTLVIDASEDSVKSGSTNPFEIERFLEMGVDVYSYDNLHAKVYVFGNIALVGSANASTNSANNLKECMVEFKNPGAVATARGFVRSVAIEPLGPEYIEYLKTLYKPNPKSKNKIGKGKAKNNQNSLWIQKLHEYDYTDSEQKAHDIGKEKVIDSIVDTDRYQIDSIRYKNNETLIKNSMIGDFIIRVYEGNAYPPARILGYEKSENDDSTIILLEEPVEPKLIKDSRFIKMLQDLGYKLIYKQFKSPEKKNAVLGLWGSYHNHT